jgi:hypothetical protein
VQDARHGLLGAGIDGEQPDAGHGPERVGGQERVEPAQPQACHAHRLPGDAGGVGRQRVGVGGGQRAVGHRGEQAAEMADSLRVVGQQARHEGRARAASVSRR